MNRLKNFRFRNKKQNNNPNKITIKTDKFEWYTDASEIDFTTQFAVEDGRHIRTTTITVKSILGKTLETLFAVDKPAAIARGTEVGGSGVYSLGTEVKSV